MSSNWAGDRAGAVTTLFVEIHDPPPIGSVVTVQFGGEDMIARARVQHRYCFNTAGGAAGGIGVRVIDWLDGFRPGR